VHHPVSEESLSEVEANAFDQTSSLSFLQYFTEFMAFLGSVLIFVTPLTSDARGFIRLS
jgi:hypothetical protein